MQLSLVLSDSGTVLFGSKYRLFAEGNRFYSDGHVYDVFTASNVSVIVVDVPEEYVPYVRSGRLLYDGTTFTISDSDKVGAEEFGLLYDPTLEQRVIPDLGLQQRLFDEELRKLIALPSLSTYALISASVSLSTVSGFTLQNDLLLGDEDATTFYVETPFLSEVFGVSFNVSHFSLVLNGWLPEEFVYEYSADGTTWLPLTIDGYSTTVVVLESPSDIKIRISGTPVNSIVVPTIKQVAVVY